MFAFNHDQLDPAFYQKHCSRNASHTRCVKSVINKAEAVREAALRSSCAGQGFGLRGLLQAVNPHGATLQGCVQGDGPQLIIQSPHTCRARHGSCNICIQVYVDLLEPEHLDNCTLGTVALHFICTCKTTQLSCLPQSLSDSLEHPSPALTHVLYCFCDAHVK